MALVYVYSGAGGAGTGADWANAYTTLAAAFAAKAAGDTFYVADDHAETAASAKTLTSPGTAASPCNVICVRRSGGSVPPVSADLRTTGSITTTGTNSINFGAQYTYWYGVIINSSSGVGASSLNILSSVSSNAWWMKFEACQLNLLNTNASSRIIVGNTSGVAANGLLELENTTLRFGAAGQAVNARQNLIWRGTASAISASGSTPTILFQPVSGVAPVASVYCLGVDLSLMGSGSSLVDIGPSVSGKYLFVDCKLGSSVSFTTGSVTGQAGIVVTGVNCDSADTNYRYFRQTYQGTITHETTIVRTDGASDGTTTFSRKMVSTANTKFYSPLESDWVYFWNETTGSSVTLTIPVVTDNVTLTDAEAWIEVEYLGTSGFPLGSFASDRAADILATAANQTTDGSSTWTTTGLGTPVKQVLSKAVTPQEKGVVRARVCLAKASTTLYFDPVVQVT